MELVEITGDRTENEFLQLPVRLYKDEKNWIRPLDRDIKAVFDPEKNKQFNNGEAIRWILKDDKGKVVGRIACFISNKHIEKEEQPTGGIGFFECIEAENSCL